MFIKRIEFSEYGDIAAIEFEEAYAHDVIAFLTQYKIRAGASEALHKIVEERQARINAAQIKIMSETAAAFASDDPS